MKKGRFWALLPLLVFIVTYFSASLALNDFYAVPALVVFVLTLIVAFIQYPKVSFNQKLEAFGKGAGDETIILMILIFLLAGAFGSLGASLGAVSAAVNLFLDYFPAEFLIAGFFLIACFISISMGTSVGTIVTLGPVAAEIEKVIPGSLALVLGAVVGGSMFGDNLSFISDTTIAATRTQNVDMKSKFKSNFLIVLPAAVVSLALYYFVSQNFGIAKDLDTKQSYNLVLLLPYIAVFGLAIVGLNVIWSLVVGILFFLGLGVFYNPSSFLDLVSAINNGFVGMFELSLLCLIIGGTVGVIRLHGGIDFILNKLTHSVKSKRQAELSIAGLTALTDAALANNTIAILIVGKVAKDISDAHELEPKRVASILDTVSCFMQGILPYGAQILAALAVTKIGVNAAPSLSPLDIISNLYYPFLTGISVIIFILIKK